MVWFNCANNNDLIKRNKFLILHTQTSVCVYVCIYIYIYIYISAVKQLIMINPIQNKSFVYAMCVYCVYLLCTVYINTHTEYILKKMYMYIIYII